MQLYRIRDRWATSAQEEAFAPDWAGTLQQAADCIKTIRRDDASVSRNSFLVELVDYPTDKAGLIDLLAGATELKVLRAWTSTPRGGLKEVLEPNEQQHDDGEPEPHDDSPHIEDGVDNCNDHGTGEGRFHGRM